MRTLWRYYSIRFLQAFAGSLVILALLVVVVDMLLNWGDITDAEATVSSALRVLLLRTTASYLTYLIPVAGFVGAFMAIGQAARSYEVMALRAGGISPLQAFLPLVLIGIVISALTLWLNETVGRNAAEWIAKEAGLMADSVEMKSGTVWYYSGRVIYSGREPIDSSLRDARVFERTDDGRLVRTVHATSARRLNDKQWQFENAIVRTFSPNEPERPPDLLKAKEITLDLASLRSPRLDQRELAAQPLPVLLSYIEALDQHGAKTGPARAVLHSRLSAPLLALLFVLFAIPLALSVEQTKSLAIPTLQGVAVLTAFLVLREYAGGLAFNLGGSAALLPWALLLVFATWSVWRLRAVPR